VERLLEFSDEDVQVTGKDVAGQVAHVVIERDRWTFDLVALETAD
jgi:hypothetical protein